MPVTKAIEQAVRARAQDRCEYCRVPQSASRLRFWVDHVIAAQHLGTDALDNLALACPFCNRHKGPNLAGVDVVSGSLVPLYHPRREPWANHFHFVGDEVTGTSPTGRATVQVLAMNDPIQRAVRRALSREGLLPA